METSYLNEARIILKFRLPLAEILLDFHDKVKSKTSGFASFDWEEAGYGDADLVKVKFALNGKVVDALSTVVDRKASMKIARSGVQRLKSVLQRFVSNELNIQGVGGYRDSRVCRWKNHCERKHQSFEQKCHCKVLWGRCDTKNEAFGKTKGWEKEDEDHCRWDRLATGGVSRSHEN